MSEQRTGVAQLYLLLAGTAALLLAAFFVVEFAAPARALPSFARQTGQPCGTCHTDFAELTPYGRPSRSTATPVAADVSHSLSSAMVNALAAHFASLHPPPIGGAPRQLVATGRKIFEDGMPEVNIAACAACHGPDATGSGQIPRLAGQLYPYMIKTLNNWDKERGRNPTVPDAAAIMSPVAHSLNKSQIEAVAAFVSTLR